MAPFFHFFMALSVLSLNCNGIMPRRGRDSCPTSSASKRSIVRRCRCARRGFSLRASVLCVPLCCVFFFAIVCRFQIPGVMRRGITSNVSFLSGTSCFACVVCMFPIVIPPGTPFCTTFKSKLTFLFPPCCVEISIRSLTGL